MPQKQERIRRKVLSGNVSSWCCEGRDRFLSQRIYMTPPCNLSHPTHSENAPINQCLKYRQLMFVRPVFSSPSQLPPRSCSRLLWPIFQKAAAHQTFILFQIWTSRKEERRRDNRGQTAAEVGSKSVNHCPTFHSVVNRATPPIQAVLHLQPGQLSCLRSNRSNRPMLYWSAAFTSMSFRGSRKSMGGLSSFYYFLCELESTAKVWWGDEERMNFGFSIT